MIRFGNSSINQLKNNEYHKITYKKSRAICIIKWPSCLSCNQIQTNGMIAVIWRVFCMIKKLHKYLLKLLKSSNCSRYFVNSSFSSFFAVSVVLFVLISTTYYWVSTVSQLTQLSVKFKSWLSNWVKWAPQSASREFFPIVSSLAFWKKREKNT